MNALKTLTIALAATHIGAAWADLNTATLPDNTAQAIVVTDRNAPIPVSAITTAPITTAPIQAPIVAATALQLQAATQKPFYAINEAIRLNLLTNKDAYIYILNELTGQTTLLLPNHKDNYHVIRANTLTTFPHATTTAPEFYADRAGTETFLIVASTKPLNLNQWLTQKNGMYAAGKTENLINEFNQMGVQLVDRQAAPQTAQVGANNADISSMRLYVPIANVAMPVQPTQPSLSNNTAATASSAVNAQGVTTILGTDRTLYQANELITISYGSSHEGIVNVAQIDQSGRIQILHKQKIGAKFLQLRTPAQANVQSIAAWVSTSSQDLNGADQSLLPAATARVDILVNP